MKDIVKREETNRSNNTFPHRTNTGIRIIFPFYTANEITHFFPATLTVIVISTC